jgi:hypothetical protein
MLLGRKKWEQLEKEKQEKDLPSPSKEETTIDIFATDDSKRTNVKTLTAAQKRLVERWNIWRNKNETTVNKPVMDNTNKISQQPIVEEILDEEERRNHTTTPLEEGRNEILLELLETEPDDIWINAKTNLAMDLAIDVNIKKEDLKPEEIVPKAYHEYLDVFDEVKADRSLRHDLGITKSK